MLKKNKTLRFHTRLVISLLLLIIACNSYAKQQQAEKRQRPYLGPYYGLYADIWYIDIKGNIQLEGGTKVGIPDDVGFAKGQDTFSFEVEITDIGPYVPDLRFHSYRYAFDDKIDIENVEFGEVIFAPGATARIDVFALGVIGFYNLNLYEGLNFDYGLEIRRFGGEIRVSGRDANTREDKEVIYDITSETISYLPLVHLGFNYKLGRLPIKLVAEGQGLKVGDYDFTDAKAMIKADIRGFILAAGYRTLYFAGYREVEDSSIAIRTKGSFLRVGVRF